MNIANITWSNLIKVLIISLFLFGGFFVANAQTLLLFQKNLSWNMGTANTDVKNLQQFLANQGLYKGPITGNYLFLTYSAIKQFQISQGIKPANGNFGPLTRVKANEIISAQAISNVSLSISTTATNSPTISPSDITNNFSSLQARVSALYGQVWSLQKRIRQHKETTATSTPNPTPSPTPTPVSSTTPASNPILWGAYVGPNSGDLSTFETLVNKPVKIRSTFYAFGDDFPISYSSTLGAKGKTLLIFWEPSFGYDTINNGSQDVYMKKFATDAKTYGYPVILTPFHEMNGNWDIWDGTVGNNTPAKFITAWKHVHDIFLSAGAENVKFAIDYNSSSVPDISGNQFSDYYPGDSYVDYVGVDGFNFGSPWQSFQTIFGSAITKLATYNKPIYILSMSSNTSSQKAAWITDALSIQMYKYPIAGWVWFNQNASDGNWLVNSDTASLAAFQNAIPK